MDVQPLTRHPVAKGALLSQVASALMLMMFFLGTFYLQDHRGFGALTANPQTRATLTPDGQPGAAPG